MKGRQPRTTLFPYTTLFRSHPPCTAQRCSHLPERRCLSVPVSLEVLLPSAKRPNRGSLLALARYAGALRSEEHTSELHSRLHLVCRLLLEKKNEKRHEHRPL